MFTKQKTLENQMINKGCGTRGGSTYMKFYINYIKAILLDNNNNYNTLRAF